MAPEGHNDLFPALEHILRDADQPLDCNQLFDMQAVRAVAPSANRVSDYLGILFRRGVLSRVASMHTTSDSGRARWAYVWKNKVMPAWKSDAVVVNYRPKMILDRPNIYISDGGENINIDLPSLRIIIQKRPMNNTDTLAPFWRPPSGKCQRCSSQAINHHCHGRDGSDGHLCDVCYWRSRAESASVTNAPLPVTN